MAPIITLLTDFGTADGYVGEMKGVLFSSAPNATVVDISHDVPPHDVELGRLTVARYWKRFPDGTIHVAIVDPEVGSERAALAVSSSERYLVGPDNGVLSPALLMADARAVRVPVPAHAAPTFHGRDVFAPAAAYLSLGVPLHRFGPEIADPVRVPWPKASREGDALVGQVVHIDRFGNLVTSIRASELAPLGPEASLVVEIGLAVVFGLSAAYTEQSPGGLGAIVGSSNRLELFARDGNCRDRLGVTRGARVTVRKR